ncbi:calponin homology domain-containing protein DDB_G0272472-like [Varroa destructor]|uniref:Uncharacterized protein n=1 Tax=Varroa destructor TaxID=109461 RepID=A0A7M7JLV0_VARDE|nr:calponin homology domain-containing protein DDB_G0272472-like [Varroa destructor]
MSSDVGPMATAGSNEPTHTTRESSSNNRRDPSYVGISCTNYGYADYSRLSRNFTPVSRVALDPPPEGAPFATALTNNAFHNLSAVCSPVNEIRIETAFEVAAPQQNGGKNERPSIIAQRIQSLYGEKTKEEFKKRSKSAGPFQRSPYEIPSYKAGVLDSGSKFDIEKEELRPSNFPKSVKEKTAFVEKLIKKDVKEGVKPLEELKKPPRFEIPSRQKSEEYYRQQREIEKQKALLFSQRLKEAEERRKAQEAVEAEQRRVAEERRVTEEQLQAESEKQKHSRSTVETIPQYSKVEREQVQVVELINTSLGSSDSLIEGDGDADTVATDGSSAHTSRSANISEDQGVDEIDLEQLQREVTIRTEEITETRVEELEDGSFISGSTITKTTTVVNSSGCQSAGVEEVFGEDTTGELSSLNKDSYIYAKEKEKNVTREIGEQGKQASPHPDTWEGSSGITEIEGSDEAMAGREFLTKLDDAEDRIRKRVQITEEYLKETHSEEVHGRLRAAIGKGNLLIAQKCKQFRGLCEKNLGEPVEGEFPTTRGDLEGFWDMILIQIDQVLGTFTEIEAMRANGWKEVPRESSHAKSTISDSPVKKKLPNPLRPRNGSASADKQREEARKRLMEAKRAAKERADQPGGDTDVIL